MFNNSRPRGDSQAADSGQAGRVMPQLTRLSVGVDGKAINRLISCCPNLQDWDINGGETNRSIPTACGPSALDNLTQLQHLSKLTFCLTASGSGRLQPRPPSGNLPRSHLRAIVKVEGLKDLRLLMCDTVPYLADLELLTALRQLKHSSCYIPGGWGRFSPYDKDYLEDIQVEFTNQAAVDEPADVWKQLAEHLMHCKARYGSQTYQKEHLYRTTGYVLDGDHDEQDL